MRDSERHRASFGMTIENVTTRVWFCCRSAVVVSEAFDFTTVRVLIFVKNHKRIPNVLCWNTIRSLKS